MPNMANHTLANRKVVILLLDSFGIGASPDAEEFGDQGADTLGHIVEKRSQQGKPLYLPNLNQKGLGQAAQAARKSPLAMPLDGNGQASVIDGMYGYCQEISRGKDTPSGHWELAGVPVLFDWHYFKKNPQASCFPDAFLTAWQSEAGLQDGVIDAGHASGTQVLKDHGVEHCLTKKPIIYTSADSVFQVAAHEEYFGLEELYRICHIAREVLNEQGLVVGRVIARPFTGESSESYQRSAHRKDYSILPPKPTLLDHLKQAGGDVVSIGKIADIYAHQGITQSIKADGISGLFDATLEAYDQAQPNTLIFTNFVDFDAKYGHRRDVFGYAASLEYFDQRLPELNKRLDQDTIVIVAADHGCDPTWHGTDHTREYIPFLLWGLNIQPQFVGCRETFADIGQTIADYMGLMPLEVGASVFEKNKV